MGGDRYSGGHDRTMPVESPERDNAGEPIYPFVWDIDYDDPNTFRYVLYMPACIEMECDTWDNSVAMCSLGCYMDTKT